MRLNQPVYRPKVPTLSGGFKRGVSAEKEERRCMADRYVAGRYGDRGFYKSEGRGLVSEQA